MLQPSKCKLFAFLLLLPGCLGGAGYPDAGPQADARPTLDAAPRIDAVPPIDADPLAPDAIPVPDAMPEIPPAACVQAMKAAPIESQPFTDALLTAVDNTWDGTSIPAPNDPAYPGGKYRTIPGHPGCSTAGLSYTPADIPGYACAAKEYPFPDGVSEDLSKPIVLLIHGNSDVPLSWEAFLHPNPGSLPFPADTTARPQLAEILPQAGFRTIAVDLRIDLVDDPVTGTGSNAARNVDHGWAVPIAQALIKQVIINNPGRRVSLVGFSLGSTVIRDALRRLWVEWKQGDWDINVFARVDDVILTAAGNHGVSTYPVYCNQNWTMVGYAACQFGQRNTYTQVPFHAPLNGPAVPPELTRAGEFGGWYETPCADGDYAFGTRQACEGSVVEYTTITMRDIADGQQQDEFVSEHSSRLYPEVCANNLLNELADFDTSGYFANGFINDHFGAARSNAGLAKITAALSD